VLWLVDLGGSITRGDQPVTGTRRAYCPLRTIAGPVSVSILHAQGRNLLFLGRTRFPGLEVLCSPPRPNHCPNFNVKINHLVAGPSRLAFGESRFDFMLRYFNSSTKWKPAVSPDAAPTQVKVFCHNRLSFWACNSST
jgi:hypothetical protein